MPHINEEHKQPTTICLDKEHQGVMETTSVPPQCHTVCTDRRHAETRPEDTFQEAAVNRPLNTRYSPRYTEEQFDKLCEEHGSRLIHRSLKSIDASYIGLKMHGISRGDNMWYVFDKYLTDIEKIDFKNTIEKTRKKFEEAKEEKKWLKTMHKSDELNLKDAYDKRMADKPTFEQWCVSKGIHPENPSGMHRHVGQETWEDYINEVDPKGYEEPRIPGVNFFPC